MTESANRIDISKLTWSVPECARLATEFNNLKQAYGAAVDRLFAVGYRLTDAEHRNLKAATETARIRWEAARVLLERHQRNHAGAR